MKIFKKNFSFALSYLAVCLILAALFTFAYNFAMLRKAYSIAFSLEQQNIDFLVSIVFLPFSIFMLTFTLLCFSKIEKFVFGFLIAVACVVSYAQIYYGIVFDKEMIRNIFETDQQEATAYLSLNLIVWLVLLGALPIALLSKVKIKYPSAKREILQKLGSLISCFAVIGLIATFNFDDYATAIRNNVELRSMPVPFYALKSTYKYVKKTYFTTPLPYVTQGTDAQQAPREGKRNLVVLIVGETQRAMNYQLNGYSKPTNEFTIPKGVFSFKDVSSCGTATAQSVPCMFSNLGREKYNIDKANAQDNILHVLTRAGVNVLWLENDGGCKGVCDKVPNIDLRKKYMATGRHSKYCPGKSCYDEVFMPELDETLGKLPRDKDTLLVLHVMGSHGPAYFERYPLSAKKFTPDCDRSDVQFCTLEELSNEYDNTIRYFDYVMSLIIDKLAETKDLNASLFFVSDHGESLGENGIYLHGLPYMIAPKEQTHVPLLAWMPDNFNAANGVDVACVKQYAATGTYSHDNLFDTLLGLFRVKTEIYRPEMDILKPCVKN